jgi:glycosyltransferase involved in cell wall biosynthesis
VLHRALYLLRRHWLIALIVAAGVGLRILTIIAYRPAIIYVDSTAIYLNHLPGSTMAGYNFPSPDPLGYTIMLRVVFAVGNLFTVTLIQHILGVAMGIGTYAVLVHRGAWRWLAALAAAPILLDAYQIFIEHMIMSDTLFEALIAAGFITLVWNRRPGPVAITIAGACIGASAMVRTLGTPLIAVFLIYVMFVVAKPILKVLGAVLVALGFMIPVLGYTLYMANSPAQFNSDNTTATALYARAATFVDCSTLKIPQDERGLCPTEPLGQRHGPDYYAHTYASPAYHVLLTPNGPTLQQLEKDFALRAMKQQPLRLSQAVLRDAVRLFTWNHDNLANPDAPAERWRFQATYPVYPTAVTLKTVSALSAQYGGGAPREVPLAAALMREYQLDIGFTPGPVMALCLLTAVAGVCGLGRWRRAPDRAAAFVYLAGAVVVLGAADFYEFTWRYQLPALVLVPIAGVLGLTTLMWRPAPVPFPAFEDDLAIDDFADEYGEPDLPPVVVVIAAYNEAKGIGAVLDGMPKMTEGPEPLDIATIVVVDGAADDTAKIARAHGAYVCDMVTNRGQGAALRLGYHLARTGGARYIVTTDADGQYDIGQLDTLLAPLLADEADFVTGSRRLGVDDSHDSVRRTGVRVFALIVSVLTRNRVTDTSFGFRAMRAEITGNVTLDQPQYQSSELLIGVISRGYRVVELPMTMRIRNQGKSKKGNNVLYGMRYARVVFSTWARERRSRLDEVKTKRSSNTNLATNVTAYDPK